MLLFLRVTTPALAKSTEKQSDTSPVQMCNYNRISLMGGVQERKKKKKKKGERERKKGEKKKGKKERRKKEGGGRTYLRKTPGITPVYI